MNRLDIQNIGSNKFLVGLSRNDMEQLDITYDSMDYSNIETRRVIWTILDRVRKSTGKDVDPSGNLMIEAAPDSTGGCFLMFTVPVSAKNTGTVISKTNGTRIYEFENTDNFLDALALIPKNTTTKLFSKDGKYRIELPSENALELHRMLEEYGHFAGNDIFTVAATNEHWQELTPKL